MEIKELQKHLSLPFFHGELGLLHILPHLILASASQPFLNLLGLRVLIPSFPNTDPPGRLVGYLTPGTKQPGSEVPMQKLVSMTSMTLHFP